MRKIFAAITRCRAMAWREEFPQGNGEVFFIAMTVAAICIVCTVGAARWQPYRPMAQQKPTIEKPIKDQARMEIRSD